MTIGKNNRREKGNNMQRLIVSATVCLLAATSFAAEPVAKEGPRPIRAKSGLEYTALKEGAGAVPGPTDTVLVNYRGTLPNGREFDSSYKRGKPTEFRLGSVIACWTEGLQLMKVGGKARLVCPPNLAYGDDGIPGTIPRFAELTFEVELLDIR